MFVWELKRQLKNALPGIVLYSLLIAGTILFFFFLDSKGWLAQELIKSMRRLPEMVTDGFAFLKSEELSSAMKGYLCLMLLIFLPVLYYAMMLPMHAFEYEEDMGTIIFTCNGKVLRRWIFWAKCSVSFFYYALGIIVWFLVSLILLVSYEDRVGKIRLLWQLVNIWAGIFFIGIVMMTLAILFVSLKKKMSVAGDFSFYIIFVLTIIRLLPFILSFVSSVMFQFGYKIKVITDIIQKIDALGRGIILFWCNPLQTYVCPIALWQIFICIIAAVLIITAADWCYERREFGV